MLAFIEGMNRMMISYNEKMTLDASGNIEKGVISSRVLIAL
jgi:hypothetical protein